jgi:carbamate kinase
MNELASRGRPRTCATVITTVRVHDDDPAFSNPAKPVGPFLTREQAERHADIDGWNVIEDAGRGWRRVVPSPVPREIIELDVIRSLVKAGQPIVACGGGGIPVRRDERGGLVGVEAVIDKDRTSALLALGLGADVFAMLTGVDQVQIDFGTPKAKAVSRLSANQALQLLVAGQFPPGSMGPKIEAAVEFLNHSTNASPQVIITSCEQIEPALAGTAGTRLTRD